MKNIFKSIHIVSFMFMLSNITLAPKAQVYDPSGILLGVIEMNLVGAYGLMERHFIDRSFIQDGQPVTEETLQIPEGNVFFRIDAIRKYPAPEIICRLEGFKLKAKNYMRDLPRFKYMHGCVIEAVGLPPDGNEDLNESNLASLLACKTIQIVRHELTQVARIFPLNIPEENRANSFIAIMDLLVETWKIHERHIMPATAMDIRLLDIAIEHWVNTQPDVSLDWQTLKIRGLDIKSTPDGFSSRLHISSDGKPLMNILVPTTGLMEFLEILHNGRHFFL